MDKKIIKLNNNYYRDVAVVLDGDSFLPLQILVTRISCNAVGEFDLVKCFDGYYIKCNIPALFTRLETEVSDIGVLDTEFSFIKNEYAASEFGCYISYENGLYIKTDKQLSLWDRIKKTFGYFTKVPKVADLDDGFVPGLTIKLNDIITPDLALMSEYNLFLSYDQYQIYMNYVDGITTPKFYSVNEAENNETD
ncbi:MAG: hypothetical protein M0R03_22550 [Novosphingobium sp.]|nr:hypothetical protein [Novosphingobium sp.]